MPPGKARPEPVIASFSARSSFTRAFQQEFRPDSGPEKIPALRTYFADQNRPGRNETPRYLPELFRDDRTLTSLNWGPVQRTCARNLAEW
jgi:hypothetical protein